ncbi:methyltransferase domain-containing protein [bacterium]|nr:methyltransferase domain-containing protein [bacterium]
MRFDVDRLQAFYATPLGRLADEMVAARIAALWPGAQGLDMLGVGYCPGILDVFLPSARRVLWASPEEVGAFRWPADGKSLTSLVEEERLPFLDAIFDRVVIRHALEDVESPRRFLREIWRVMAPEGRLIVVAAHRRGLWARAESTPYGHGRPYTRSQLTRLLEDGMFRPTASARALYAPPIDWPVITSTGDAWERAGRFGWSSFGGVLMVEAVKHVMSDPMVRASRRRQEVRAPAHAAPAQSDPLDDL